MALKNRKRKRQQSENNSDSKFQGAGNNVTTGATEVREIYILLSSYCLIGKCIKYTYLNISFSLLFEIFSVTRILKLSFMYFLTFYSGTFTLTVCLQSNCLFSLQGMSSCDSFFGGLTNEDGTRLIKAASKPKKKKIDVPSWGKGSGQKLQKYVKVKQLVDIETTIDRFLKEVCNYL